MAKQTVLSNVPGTTIGDLLTPTAREFRSLGNCNKQLLAAIPSDQSIFYKRGVSGNFTIATGGAAAVSAANAEDNIRFNSSLPPGHEKTYAWDASGQATPVDPFLLNGEDDISLEMLVNAWEQQNLTPAANGFTGADIDFGTEWLLVDQVNGEVRVYGADATAAIEAAADYEVTGSVGSSGGKWE